MDVIVPFKWTLSPQKLKELNSCNYVKKYLCTIMERMLHVKLKLSRRGDTTIELIGARKFKSAVVNVDSLVTVFLAVPLTQLDCQRMRTNHNGETSRRFKPSVNSAVKREEKLIIKGRFNLKIVDREGVSIIKDSAGAHQCVSTSIPNEVPICNTPQKCVADLSCRKQIPTDDLDHKKPIITIDKCISTSIPDNTMDSQVAEIFKDLETMYNNSEYSDVIITCQSQQFRAHKVILKARCPDLLPDDLKTDPNEMAVITKINMDHLPVRTVTTLLLYIYTGKLELTLSLACDLISAANMYNIRKLKDVCMKFLVNALNDENVLFVYMVSNSIDEIMKENALKYIIQHFSSISNSTVWEQFNQARPDISIALLSEIVKRKDNHLIDLTSE